MVRNKRIVLGLLDICLYYSTLTRGLLSIGADAHLIDLDKGGLEKGVNEAKSRFVKCYLRAYKRFVETRQSPRTTPSRYLATVRLVASQWMMVLWILLLVDVLVLKSGESFFPSKIDLRIFKFFKKTVIFIFHGSDSRPPYLNGFYSSQPETIFRLWVEKIWRSVLETKGLATYVVDNPLSAQFQQVEKCVLYQVIGNPIDSHRLNTVANVRAAGVPRGRFRIMHAPSNAALKGTDQIRSCIKRLQDDGHEIDYIELSGVPNCQVIAELERSDLVIDELYSDMHGATFSMEALAVGRPVIVGGYGFDVLDQLVPPQFVPPTIRCLPEFLYSTLTSLLENRDSLHLAGVAGKAFFYNVGSAEKAAARLLVLADGKAPPNWFFKPKDITYVHGVAGTAESIFEAMARYISHFGVDALLLDEGSKFRNEILKVTERHEKLQDGYISC